jgi:hypothetical protein
MPSLFNSCSAIGTSTKTDNIDSILAIGPVKIRISTNYLFLINMKTSNNIESILLKNGSSTVRDLSLALDVSKADIRYNLKLLKNAKRIAEVPPTSNPTNRGRPSTRFFLINYPTVSNLEHLLNQLLTGLLSTKSPAQIVDLLLSDLLDDDDASLSPLFRVNKTIEFMGNLGIIAIWSAGKTGPQISIITNPYKKENPQPFELIVDLLVERAIDYASKI